MKIRDTTEAHDHGVLNVSVYHWAEDPLGNKELYRR
jgi:hypothetical protein